MEDSSSETSKSLISIPSTIGGGLIKPPKASSLKIEAKAKIASGLTKSRSMPPSRSTATTQSTPPKATAENPTENMTLSRSDLLAQQAAQETALREAHTQKEKERAHKKEKKASRKDRPSHETKKRGRSLHDSKNKKSKDPAELFPPSSSGKAHLQSSQHSSRLKKRRRISSSPSADRVDPTLDAHGRKTRRPNSPPLAQTLDIHDDEHYPSLSSKRVKTRALEREILSLIKGREDFGKFTEEDIIDSAENLFLCGISSIDELKKSRQVNRTFMLEDLRGKGFSASDLELILALFHTYPVQVRDKTSKKLQEELHIPTLMAKLTGDLSSLSPLIAPDQAIVNEITRQLQEGDSCVPRFKPFVLAQLHLEPFRSPSHIHDNITTDWADRMKSMRSAQPLPFQAYLLFQNRFIMAGQLCSAWEHFGGFAAQMNAQAVMLTIAVTDNVGVAIAYDMQIRKHIAHLARQRHTDVDFAHLLSKENEDIKRQVLAQRIPKAPAPEKEVKKKGKGKGKKPFAPYKKPWEKRYGKNTDAYERERSDKAQDNRYGPQDRHENRDRRTEGSAKDRKDSPKRNADSSHKKKEKN